MTKTNIAAAGKITRAELARRLRVSKTRVGHWLAEGKIGGDAVVGTGRGLRIREALALEQLRENLSAQHVAANGDAADLDNQGPQIYGPSQRGPYRRCDTTVANINLAKLEGLRRRNREAARREHEQATERIDARAARAIADRELAELRAGIEAALLNDVAAAFATNFHLPPATVRVTLAEALKATRAK